MGCQADFAFVSHAHSDHIAPHREIIVSERTARLMQARMPGERHEHHSAVRRADDASADWRSRFCRPVISSVRRSSFFETEHDSLLYTGDFKLRPGRSAEPAEWTQADTLIMETTYGLPRYRLPPTETVIAQIVAFCRDALEEGDVPVLLGYSLGKAQEILCSLSGAGLTPMLHGSVFQMTRIYEQFGQQFCEYVRYDPNDLAGKVLICPPSANRSRMLEKIPRKRVAMISGWAVDPSAIYRYQVDAAFPLSDHADYDDLLRYVELVQPNRVLTLHGFAAEFARDLRERGIEAWALSEENQMELTLRNQVRRCRRPRRPTARRLCRRGRRQLQHPNFVTVRRGRRIDRRNSGEAREDSSARRLLRARSTTRDFLSPRFTSPDALSRKPICALCRLAGSVIYRALIGGGQTQRSRISPHRLQSWRRGQDRIRSA